MQMFLRTILLSMEQQRVVNNDILMEESKGNDTMLTWTLVGS